MNILYCDDNADHRRRWCENLTKVWKDLREKGILSEEMCLITCADITEEAGITDSRTYDDLAGFDGFLLDILWTADGKESYPRGIEIAEEIRKRYPEKPIMMFTQSANSQHFNRLLSSGICGYLRKGETFPAICFQIMESMERHRRARGGQCLYKELRQVISGGEAWASASVGKAASNVWNLGRSHDRWDAFWDAFEDTIASQRLARVFSQMRTFFGSADLLMLGALTGMRGHLEHVLNVFFTGYVISHRVPRFRTLAEAAAKRLFPDNQAGVSANADKHWELFQLAWLAAATLHDTAYPLEIQPDLFRRCWGITEEFGSVLSNTAKYPEFRCPTVSVDGLDDIGWLLGQLYGNSTFSTFLRDNATFTKDGVTRVNHGVASGLFFLELAKSTTRMKERLPELDPYLKWAAAAMALHSLKVPGSQTGVSILLERDPLSYLLLACDEIQVWERERPDASRIRSPLQGTDLSALKINDTGIAACIDYFLYNGAAASSEFLTKRQKMDQKIEEDNEVLGAYMDGNGFSVEMRQEVPSVPVTLAPLRF